MLQTSFSPVRHTGECLFNGSFEFKTHVRYQIITERLNLHLIDYDIRRMGSRIVLVELLLENAVNVARDDARAVADFEYLGSFSLK
jgi:hypothetical protein